MLVGFSMLKWKSGRESGIARHDLGELLFLDLFGLIVHGVMQRFVLLAEDGASASPKDVLRIGLRHEQSLCFQGGGEVDIGRAIGAIG